MSRPEYQTTDDVANEIALMKVAFPDRKAIKLPRSYQLDYWLPHPKVPPCIVECKQRSAAFREYDSYMMSFSKFLAGQRLAKAMGGFFWIVTGWGDGVVAAANLCLDLPCIYPIRLGGRTDRNDPADMEPVIHIPIGSFKEIAQKT